MISSHGHEPQFADAVIKALEDSAGELEPHQYQGFVDHLINQRSRPATQNLNDLIGWR